MNCETYETLRIEAAEAPGMAEHMADCQPCQLLHQATQWMDRELPLLDAPQLPAGFAGQVAAQARAEQVLVPWYRRLTRDAADAAEATWRSLAVGGLVGGLAGVLGAAAVATRYGAVGHYYWGGPGRWEWTVSTWTLHENFLALSAVLVLLVTAILVAALRPWLGVRRVLPVLGTALTLLALLAAAQTAGLLPVGRMSGSGLEGLGGAGLLVAGVTLLLLAGRSLLRTASSTMGQAAVFYSTLTGLYGLVELQQHWLGWTDAFEHVARTATFVLDPRLVLGGAGLWVGLAAGALAVFLLLLREPAARGRALPLLLLLLVLVAGAGGVLPLVQPPTVGLSPGHAERWTFVAPTREGQVFQDRLTVHDWQTEGNRAILEKLRTGSPLDRFYAAELRLCEDRLAWDRTAVERDLMQSTAESLGLAGVRGWSNPWWELLPAGDLYTDNNESNPSKDRLTAIVTDSGRPLAGARLFVTLNEPGSPATDPRALMSDLSRSARVLEQTLAGHYAAPGVEPDGFSPWGGWGVSDADGRVEIPRWYGAAGQLHPMLLLPGASPVRAVEGLPVAVPVPEHSLSLGTITVRR